MPKKKRSKAKETERRKHLREQPQMTIRVMRVLPHMPVADAQVINTSDGGAALRTRAGLKLGDRLSFYRRADSPPVLGEVLASQEMDDGWYIVRCRCLVGTLGAA